MDNDQGAPAYVETGSWSLGASAGYNSGAYRVAGAGKASTATWTAALPQSGNYAVSVIYLAGANRVASAQYSISAPGGVQLANANQQTNSLWWVELGIWRFDSGTASITLSAAGSSGGSVVIADAVKFAYVSDVPTPVPSPTLIPAMKEFRGLWVTGWGPGFKSASEIAALVQIARAYNINAILPEVRKRGDAYYFPTFPNTEPRADDIAPDFDPLRELIRQAHPFGIEVHAWIVAYNVENNTINPSPNHVVNAHPELLMKNSKGENFLGEGYYLDPGNPAANQWNHNVVMDLTAHYDIDGVHYDYIRYPKSDSGYNDVAVARYMGEFGWPGLSFPPSPSDPQFKAWRRRQITDWLRAAYADIIAVKPQMKVTAAVFADEDSAAASVFQEWPQWMKEGSLDALCPMNYQSDNTAFHTLADNANQKKNGRHCYMGLGLYLNPKENTALQLYDARSLGCEGSVLFAYGSTNSAGESDQAFYEHIRDKAYSEPAAPPAMLWKTQPATGYLRGKVMDSATSAILYNAVLTLQDLNQSMRSDGEGKYAFLGIPPGHYVLKAEAAGYEPQLSRDVVITTGSVTTLDIILSAGALPTPSPSPAPASDVIVDNDDGAPRYLEWSAWNTGGSAGYNQKTYRYVSCGQSTLARWWAYVQAGEYEISTIYRASPNRTAFAKYVISASDGNQIIRVDQTKNDLAWVPLGRFRLKEGYNSVTLDASDCPSTSGVVIADAVHFQKIADPSLTPTPALTSTPLPSSTPIPPPSPSVSASGWSAK